MSPNQSHLVYDGSSRELKHESSYLALDLSPFLALLHLTSAILRKLVAMTPPNLELTAVKPIPEIVFPEFQPCPPGSQPPTLPSAWSCVALLHPFSPPLPNPPDPDTPFFELCTAWVTYVEGEGMDAQIIGESGKTWWYRILPIILPDDGTNLSILSMDRGETWKQVDMGWTLPSTSWLSADASCAGVSYLNWMQAQELAWWRDPDPSPSPAATWFWFNADGPAANLPFRMMFGAPPPSPYRGDPSKLAFFQMYSFVYFPQFSPGGRIPQRWHGIPPIFGFSWGNPNGYQLFEWNSNFGMTTFMTPVDKNTNPLPTRVFYRWAPDGEYKSLTDRAQSTWMVYNYNPTSPTLYVDAYMYGIAPPQIAPPPANSGSNFLFTQSRNGTPDCTTLKIEGVALGQQLPNWVSTPGVEGTIRATLANHPTLCPDNTVTIVSVLFPPSETYTEGRYLWTWYSPFPGSDGTRSRPVTFMESASQIGKGTSLALADYFYYEEFRQPIEPHYFEAPAVCTMPTPRTDAFANTWMGVKETPIVYIPRGI